LGVGLSQAGSSRAEAWKFIVSGDSRGSDNGVNTTILAEIAQQTIAQNAEFILMPGDLVNGYTTETNLQSQLLTWRNTMQPVYAEGIGVYPVRGNHEKGGSYGVPTAWNNVFADLTGSGGLDYRLPQNGPAGEENLTWSFTHGTGNEQVLVMGLDQYYPTIDHTVPQAWVDSQLTATTAPHIFALGHEPAFSSDHNDCMDDAPEARNTFLNSLIDAGGRSYFAGHDHFYNHLRADDGDGNLDNDLHQFILGTAGAPLRGEGNYGGNTGPWTPTKDIDGDGSDEDSAFESQYGYMVVEIDALDVDMTWWHRTGVSVYEATSEGLSYTVPEPVTGDFDGDDDVDGTDFLLWQRGESPMALSPSDLATWKENFGNFGSVATVPSDAVAVPEPSAFVSMGLILACFLTRARGQSCKFLGC
jgi:hypothetical protein